MSKFKLAFSKNDSIIPEITVETPVTLTGKQNTAITEIQLNATLSNGGQVEFSSTDLPAGLTLSNTGLISGTPTISGEGSSTITVSYTGSQSKTIILNWNISEAAASDKTYVYIVSGAPSAEVNGNYYATGDELDGFPLYTNGTYYLGYSLSNETYFLSVSAKPNPIDAPLFVNEMAVSLSDYPTPVGISWYEVGGGPIEEMVVTNYAGG